MPRPRAYVDSGILILASRGQQDEITKRAMEQLEREDVDFVFSRIVELETMPAPMRNPQHAHQLTVLNELFQGFERVPCDDVCQQIAIREAGHGVGLSTGDALHVGCAINAQADYILTTESPTSQMSQCAAIPFRTIHV